METTWKPDFPVRPVWYNCGVDNESRKRVPIQVIETGTDERGTYMTIAPLPPDNTLLEPKADREWAAVDTSSSNTEDGVAGGDYLNRYKIVGGVAVANGEDGAGQRTGKLYYEVLLGCAPEPGTPLALYNIYASAWAFQHRPLIKQGRSEPWRSTYVSPGSGFMRRKRRKREFVLLVNGYNGKTKRHEIGAFRTRKYVKWTKAVRQNPVFPPQVRGQKNNMYTSGRVFKLGKGRYLAYLTKIEDPSWKIQWVTFDKNFKNVKYSKTGIVEFESGLEPPFGCASPATIRYDGKYRMMFVWRGTTNPKGWQTWEAVADNPKGPFSTVANSLCNPAIANETCSKFSYRSNHADTFGYFEWNDELHVLVGGTSRWNASGSKGKREYGLFRLDRESGQWVSRGDSPVLINPLYANEKLWGADLKWARDHIGGSPVFHIREDKKTLCVFVSANNGRDTYKVACADIPVEEEPDTNPFTHTPMIQRPYRVDETTTQS